MENSEVEIDRKICNIRWKKGKLKFRKNMYNRQNLKYHIYLFFEPKQTSKHQLDKQQKGLEKDQLQVGLKGPENDNKNQSDEAPSNLGWTEDGNNEEEVDWEYPPIQIADNQFDELPKIQEEIQDYDAIKKVDSLDQENEQQVQVTEESSCWQTAQNEEGYAIDEETINIKSNNIIGQEQVIKFKEIAWSQAKQERNSSISEGEGSDVMGEDQISAKIDVDQSMNHQFNIRIGHVESIDSSQVENREVQLDGLPYTRQIQQTHEITGPRKWTKVAEKDISMVYNNLCTQLKACLYQSLAGQHFDAVIQIWQFSKNSLNSVPKQTTSLQEICANVIRRDKKKLNAKVIRALGLIKIRRMEIRMRTQVEENIQILVGSCLKIDSEGEVWINSDPSTEQILDLLQ